MTNIHNLALVPVERLAKLPYDEQLKRMTDQAELDILDAKAEYWRNRKSPKISDVGAGIAWAGFWIGLGLWVF